MWWDRITDRIDAPQRIAELESELIVKQSRIELLERDRGNLFRTIDELRQRLRESHLSEVEQEASSARYALDLALDLLDEATGTLEEARKRVLNVQEKVGAK